MARPEGAQALRAIQKDLDEGRSLPGINYILFPKENTLGYILQRCDPIRFYTKSPFIKQQ